MSTSTPSLLIISRSLFVFAALCLFTSLIMSLSSGTKLLGDTVKNSGGELGPFTINEDNTVLYADVYQNIPRNRWSFVSLELLDKNRNFLTGFGDELWSADGYDSEGYYWQESDKNYSAKVTVNKAGTYYLNVNPDNNFKASKQDNKDINIQLYTQSQSTIPHFAAAIIALILAMFLNFFGGGLSRQLLTES